MHEDETSTRKAPAPGGGLLRTATFTIDQHTDTAVLTTPRIDRSAVLQAAGIWARAVAQRDGLPQPPHAEDKVADLQDALAPDGAQLLLTREGGSPACFAVLVPRAATTELLYLAVEPSAWGRGLGRAVLDYVGQCADESATGLHLWVIDDNDRAVRTYLSAGWSSTSETAIRNDSGRLERRLVRSPAPRRR